MKEDAFDDVQCPFKYKRELRKARRALDAMVGEYIHNNPTRSYQALSIESSCRPARFAG